MKILRLMSWMLAAVTAEASAQQTVAPAVSALPPAAAPASTSAPVSASAAPVAGSSAPSPAAPIALTAAQVDDPGLTPVVKASDKGPAVLRAEILLDRARFSPGEIDAAYGSNLRRAIAGFQASRGLRASGEMDAPTWSALAADRAPALVTVTVSAEDVAGPFRPLPAGMAAKAKLDALGYTSPLEALGEKFHASPDLLKQLNPGKDFGRAGEQLLVPDVTPAAPMPAVAEVVVSKSDSTLSLVDSAGKVVAQYPASTGSQHDPLPIGQWKILGVAHNPTYHYNPKLFWDANPKDSQALLPPGPNNPVGVVWMDLSKEHYGIHGTPEPSHIGKTESHGCIRLTNWSALEVSQAVKPGMPAILKE